MKRSSVLLSFAVTVFAMLPVFSGWAQSQTPAVPAPAPQEPAARGRGRGPQTPPPPPLTCTSKATETDNKVPAALAKEGFTAIFNGKDLTGWQALIDIGTLKFGAGLNPADLLKLSPAEKAAKQKESNDDLLETLVGGGRHPRVRRRAGGQADAARREGRTEPSDRQGIRRRRAVRRLVYRGRRRQRRLSEERAADSDVVQSARLRRPLQQQGRRAGIRSSSPTIRPITGIRSTSSSATAT